MKLYVKQKVFSFRDSFTVKDEFGNDRYNVVGDFFSLTASRNSSSMSQISLCTHPIR